MPDSRIVGACAARSPRIGSRRRNHPTRCESPAEAHARGRVIACPSCQRQVLTRLDILLATLDGRVQCPVCGRMARLDLMSRWMILCVLALSLPALLLYGGVFYSGHLFVVSMFII